MEELMSVSKSKKTASMQGKAGYFPVVGIGTSAGGLSSLETFFSGMSHKETFNMAFVVVQHLAPTHDSILTEIISRFTSMKVFEVVSGITVEQNCIYIIPPNNNMAFLEGKLILTRFDSEQNNRNPIDLFFNSLAENLGKNAVGIIFSGTGKDGSEGIKSISNNRGLVLVQTPETSEFDGMPLSAISTGHVDFVLPIIEMPQKLINHFKNRSSNNTEDFTHRNKSIKFGKTVADILELVKIKTGNDFSQYKASTIERRIERRQSSLNLKTLDDYLIWLKKTPDEVEALFQDILIGLTSFFRDKEAFNALNEKVIPRLFEDKPNGGLIRIWSAGCSTGEEAYSIAILIHEQLQLVKQLYTIQIFATDLDGFAISKARTGVFSKSIEDQISSERLERYFVKKPDENSYQIKKGIRDMLIFSEHNVIKSPPFSKIDLIVCRNLMIYLDSQLQKKLLATFHFALNQGGILFLGSSETYRDSNDLFA
ncbi:MAG: CheR family methyltransferase, partial [Bacillota bacterium]